MGTTQLGALPGTSGTFVELQEPSPQAISTPFGSTLMVGAFQWGPVDEVVLHSGVGSYRALRGTHMRADVTPTTCEHWYQMAKGAGRLLTLRLTDGNELQSVLDLYARDIDLTRNMLTPAGPPTRALRVQGLHPGRRGGVDNVLVGRVSDRAANFSATAGTFDTETAMVVDAYVDALLYIDGVSRSYRVTANDVAGVLSIEVPPGDAGPAASAGNWTIVLGTPDADGDRDGLGVQIDTSQTQPASEWKLTIHDLRAPGPVSPAYSSLSLDATLDAYVEQQVNVDGTTRRQNYITTDADPDGAIGDPSADDLRPANFVGLLDPTLGTRSHGLITDVAKASHVDGETLIIGDGRQSITFEYDVAGDGVTSGNTQVDISGDTTAADVAATLLAAINASALKIEATPDATGKVYLTGAAGDYANVTITHTVADGSYAVSGMVDGAGPSATLDLLTWFWARTSPGGGDAWVDPTSISYGAACDRRVVAICTFSSPTAYAVEYKDWNEDTTYATGLAAGALGTAYDSGSVALPGFTLRVGASALAATDVIRVYFQPLPSDLKLAGGRAYAHAHDQGDSTNNIRTSFAVKANTRTQVSLPTNTDVGVDHLVAYPGRPIAVSPTAETYNLAGGETFIYVLADESAVTLTQTVVDAAATAAELAAELNTQEAAAHADLARVQFSANSAGQVVVEALYCAGESATMQITTGTLNTILGFTNSTTYTGSEGSAVALSYAQHLEGGLDGVSTLGEGAEYVDAFDLSTSPINNITTKNYGLVKVAMPGVSGSSETEQNAMIAYCDAKGYAPRCEVDVADATDEDTAATHVRDNLTGSRNRALAWPSYGYVRNRPFTGLETPYPLTGAILGVEAYLAAKRGGYHVTAAGTKASVGEIFSSLATVASGEDAPRYDEAILNPAGIQAVQQEGALIFPNGGRNSADDYAGTVWKHMQDCMLHMMHLLRVAGAVAEWEPNDPETRGALVAALIPKFQELDTAGWFRRESGQTFFDRIQIQAGDDENTAAVQALGELRALVQTSGIVGTNERVVFALGTGGVSAG